MDVHLPGQQLVGVRLMQCMYRRFMRLREAFLGKAFEKGCLSFVSSLRETVAEPRKKQTFYTFIHFYVQIILASLVVLHSESGGCFKQFLDVLKPQVGETIRFGSDHVLKWGGGKPLPLSNHHPRNYITRSHKIP